MKHKLALVLSVVALVVALFGSTPLGEAGERVRVALFARNAGKVSGIEASRVATPRKLLALDRNGRFPVSVVPPEAFPGYSRADSDARYHGRNARGIALLGASVKRDGSLTSWFNVFAGPPTVSHAGEGIYRVAFPGVMFSYDRAIYAVTPRDEPAAVAAVGFGGGQEIEITFRQPGTGNLVDRAFSLVVFDASLQG
jgi:hypothetical protein